MYCPKCGAKIEDDSMFCEECGAKLEDEIIQPAVETEESNANPTDLSKNTVLDNKSAKTKKSILTKKMIIATVSIFVALAVLITGIVISNNLHKTKKKTVSEEDNYDKTVVGVAPDYEPFEYYSANKLTEFDIDLIQSIADYSDLKIKMSEVDEYDDLFAGLQSGKFDCVISAINYTEELASEYGCTDVYYSDIDPDTNEKTEYVICTAKENEELIEKLNSGISYLKNNSEINRIAKKYGVDNQIEVNPQETTSSESSLNKKTAGVEWTTVEYNIHDSQGYKYLVSLKISPLIMVTNSDTLKSAWNVVGKSNQLPKFEDWYLSKQNNYYKRDLTSANNVTRNSTFTAYKADEMYYCVGSVSVKNITEGWNITSENYRSLTVPICFKTDAEITEGIFKGTKGINDSNCIGRIFYGNKAEDFASGFKLNPKMEGNYWGPCSFVIAFPEVFDPNNPNGKNHDQLVNNLGFGTYFIGTQTYLDSETVYVNSVKMDKDNTTTSGGTGIGVRLGVIDKDGVFSKAN